MLALAPALSAQNVRLNGPLVQPGTGDVLADFAFSADSQHVVYRADGITDEAFELFVSPTDGSGPALRLNLPLPPGRDVVRFAIGAGRVVYVADQETDEVFELFSVPMTGGAAVKLSGALVTDGDVAQLLVTPDGTRAVFAADKLVDERFEFFSAPIDGSAAPTALDPSPTPGNVEQSWMAPDGSRVLYMKTETELGQNPSLFLDHVFTLALNGGPTKVELAVSHLPSQDVLFPVGSVITDLRFSANGQYVVYSDAAIGKIDRGGPEVDGETELQLFSVPLDGSTAPVLLTHGYIARLTFQASADRVVFTQSNLFVGTSYSVALDGTDQRELAPGLFSGDMTLSPDGTQALFLAGTTFGGTRALFRTPADGSGSPVQLFVPGLTVSRLMVTESAVFYSTGETFRGLYVAPLDGSSPPTLLNGPALANSGSTGVLTRLPGDRVLFLNSVTANSDLELRLATLAAPAQRISAVMPPDRDVTAFLATPDGERVAYLADQTNDSTFELFAASLSEATPPVSYLAITPGPVAGDVLGFRPSTDGVSVIYRADQDVDGRFQLYRSFLDRRSDPYPLGFASTTQADYALSPTGGRVVLERGTGHLFASSTAPGSTEIVVDGAPEDVFAPIEISASGNRAVYRKLGINSNRRLLSTNIIAPALPIALFGSQSLDVAEFQLSPGGRAVYRLQPAAPNRVELFSRAIEGGQASKALAPNVHEVRSFRIAPDGVQVAYRADQAPANVVELYLAPVDGSVPARRLSATPAAAGGVADFVFSPDGGRVAYRADLDASGVLDLFSTSTVGDPVVIPLTDLGAGTLVSPDYRVGPDGQHVYFRANPDGPEELFRVPLLGGSPPQRLSAPLMPRRSVLSFELSPDGKRVVYLAAEDGHDVRELFSVPADGGPVTALDPLQDFADVLVYRVDPDSRTTAYLCDRKSDGVDELFTVLLDGSQSPVRINDPLPSGGEVQPDFVLLPGGIVVFRADQETDEVFELLRGDSDPWRRANDLTGPRHAPLEPRAPAPTRRK